MTTQGIPSETIKVGVLHEEIPNPMREYYNQGWNDCAIKANETLTIIQAEFADAVGWIRHEIDKLMADLKDEPNQVVQAGTDLVDNAMKDLLNHGCKEVYSDYLTIGQIEKWLSSGNGSKYLAALVEAVRTAQR